MPDWCVNLSLRLLGDRSSDAIVEVNGKPLLTISYCSRAERWRRSRQPFEQSDLDCDRIGGATAAAWCRADHSDFSCSESAGLFACDTRRLGCDNKSRRRNNPLASVRPKRPLVVEYEHSNLHDRSYSGANCAPNNWAEQFGFEQEISFVGIFLYLLVQQFPQPAKYIR